MKKRKIVATMLIASVITGAISGCGSSFLTNNQISDMAESSTSENGASTTAKSGEQSGGYLEQSVKDIMSESDKVLTTTVDKDGNVYVYTYGSDYKVTKHTYSNGSWNSEAFSSLDGMISDTKWVSSLVYGMDGNEYAVCEEYSADGNFLSSTLKNCTTNEECQIELNQSPSGVAVDAEGNILIVRDEKTTVYDKNGSQLCEIETATYPSMMTNAFGIYGTTFVCLNVNNNAICIYNTVDGSKIGEISCKYQVEEDIVLSIDKDNNIYVVDSTGIQMANIVDSQFSQIVNGATYRMGSGYLVNNLAVIDKNNFYIAYSDWSTGENFLCNYKYSEDAFLGENVLKVCTLKESQSLQKIISEYKEINPEVTIDLQILNDDTLTHIDKVKNINTEILNGEGADIYVLDGLPMDAYIEKGVLADITDIYEETNLLSTIKDDFIVDGKVYAIPTRMGIPMITGEASDINAMDSLEGLKGLAESGRFKVGMNERLSLIEWVSTFYYNDIINEDGSVDEAKLMLLCECLENIQDNGGVIDDEESTEDFLDRVDMGAIYTPYTRATFSPFFDYARGEMIVGFAEAGTVLLESVGSAVYKNTEIRPINKTYFPYNMVGINSESSNMEGAKEFIKLLLSDEIQKKDFEDGFPVTEAGIEGYKKLEKNNISTGFELENGEEVIFEWPKEEDLVKYMDSIKTVETPVIKDDVLIEIIKEECKAMLLGNQDKATAVSNIMKKAQTYYLEK